MTAFMHSPSPRQLGFTLIELMVAMVLGLLVAAGIVTVFASTSSSNKAQAQVATLQESGRFAMERIKTDVGSINSQYGTNTGGSAVQSGAGLPFLDGLRAPAVYVKGSTLTAALSDVTTPWGGIYPAEPVTGPYSMPSFLTLRGYDCGLAACTPVNPDTAMAINPIPAMGKTAGKRVVGAAVLTMRYLNPTGGWAIEPPGSSVTGSTLTADVNGLLKQITLTPIAAFNEPPVSVIKAGDLIMLANYSDAQIFAVTGQGTSALVPAATNFTAPSALARTEAIKVFDLNRDFQTVTYYLKVVDAGNGHTTGALMRRVNGGLLADGVTPAGPGASEDELVRGVERMDFRYGVINGAGKTQFLTAKQVDTATDGSGNAIACPPGPAHPVVAGAVPGCLWRAVQSVQVDLLMDGQIPLYTLSANELQYAYSSDTNIQTRAAPAAHAVKPSDQGFPDQLLRREFTALIAVRNYNP